MNWMLRCDRILAAIERLAAVMLFSVLVLGLFLNIVLRAIFGISLYAVPEFTPAIVLWLALIGASLALRQGRHVKIELLLRYASVTARRVAKRITAVFGLFLMGVLCLAATEFLRNEIVIFGIAGTLSAILPLFCAVAFFRFLLQALDPDVANTAARHSGPNNTRPKAERP